MLSSTPNARIGDVLRRSGMVTDEQLDAAESLARAEGIRIGEALIRMGVLDEGRLAWALGMQFDLSYVDLDPEMIDWGLVRRFPLERLRELVMLPISDAGGAVRVVVADPTNAALRDAAEELFGGREVVVQLADDDAILAMLSEAERHPESPVPDFPTAEGSWRAASLRWLNDCLADLSEHAGERLVVLEESAEGFALALPRSNPQPTIVARPLVDALLHLLPKRFASDFAVPGGFAGSLGTLRVTAVTGTRGRLIVFERISSRPASTGCVLTVGTRHIARAKAALLHGALPFAASFEAHLDVVGLASIPQFAIADDTTRRALCRRLAPALAAQWILFEGDSTGVAIPSGLVELRHVPSLHEFEVGASGPAAADDLALLEVDLKDAFGKADSEEELS